MDSIDKITTRNTANETKKEEKPGLCIERAHRVARRPGPGRSAGRGRSNHGQDGPKPIVAKFLNWKEKEQVLAAARKIKPPDVLFLQDFSQQTLERRKEQIPKMLAARDQDQDCLLYW